MSDFTLRKRANYSRIALEIIDFQNNSFGIQIETIVTSIREALERGEIIDPLVTKLEKLIFTRLGLKVITVTDWDPLAMVAMNFNKSKVLLPAFLHGKLSDPEQNKVIKEARNKKGHVDLHAAKVSGIFSEYNNQLYVNFQELIKTWGLNDAEITAGILHELGHAFYACEYEDRLESTNQVLANLVSDISGKKEKDLTYIFKELKSLDNTVTEEDVETIVNGNRIIAGYRLLSMVIKNITSNIPDPTYDRTSNEQLADNFVSRFGYGKPLIGMLSKLHSYFGDPNNYKETNPMDNSLRLLPKLFTFEVILSALIGVASIPAGIFALVLIYVSFKPVVKSFITQYETFESTNPYDTLRDRFKRIRNEYVANLKAVKLTNEELSDIVSNIKILDTLIGNIDNTKKSFINSLFNALFGYKSKAKKSYIEQRLLEDLAFNDLFLKSAELKTL